MASVSKRQRKVGVDHGGKAVYRDDGWIVRYVDPEGVERKRSFPKKGPASLFAAEVEQAKARGIYVDLSAGKVTFKAYAEAWRAAQPHRKTTAEQAESRLRLHIYPAIGHRPMASIRRTELQNLIRDRGEHLAPATLEVVAGYVATIFKAAVADRVIGVSPATSLKLPQAPDPDPVVPFEPEEWDALVAAMPGEWQLSVLLGVGAGLRAGEMLGVTVDRVRFLQRELVIDQQMVTVTGSPPTLSPPKTKASKRTIPLPADLVAAITEHVRANPPGGEGLLFTHRGGGVRKARWSDVWRAAVAGAGLDEGTRFHRLRHTYASLLIRHGCSVKVVQARLGHATAQETLDTYGHLWPDDDDRTREAVATIFAKNRARSAHGRPTATDAER